MMFKRKRQPTSPCPHMKQLFRSTLLGLDGEQHVGQAVGMDETDCSVAGQW